MDDRRKSRRDKVVYGGVAAINERGSTRDCVVRNISDNGATIEFGTAAGLSDQIALTVAKKARTYPSKIVWRRGNTVGLAFSETTDASQLSERLRKSEKTKRELQRKIKVLLGES
ncbi:PilZ domain-containing protein [Rhodopseudomonas pseudopalustris]|uniref:Type IV pilus assembly PilZ n=2 Tax=Rhodopseudomonas TaxID=1073 RepID=Q135G0_RHOPS|nr:PilZ domain-containing protein [Rhodopseudomonas pseudopalustris]ABE40279.1 type IV pilus assembly PilZ [Rhodopseudomonas palustris BisB5]MBB1093284.1 PilZ domain-containing protein [Rhodopseudomonas palustris]SEP10014.1 PilZ domain-containing protein [Rhodopseudomonas pseudopalustris]